MALQVIELPPGAQTDWARHLYDEVFYVLSGHGSTSIEPGEGETRGFEWGPRALFSPPLNAPLPARQPLRHASRRVSSAATICRS